MIKYLKYIPWLVLVLAVAIFAGYQTYQLYQTRQLLGTTNEQLMAANLEIGRAHTQIVDNAKLHATAMAEIDQKWKDEIKKNQALITMYATLEAKYEAEKKKEKIVVKVVYRDQAVDLPDGGLWVQDEDGKFLEVTSLTFDYKDFRIDIDGDAIKKTINYKLHQTFRAQIIETTLPSGVKNSYAKIYEVDTEGKDVGQLQVTKFEVLQMNQLKNHMMWWNPKLDLHVGVGINQKIEAAGVGEIGLSFSSYGKTEDDNTWRFFRLGLGVTNGPDFSVTLSPAQYNFAKHLPLVSNLYATPYVGLIPAGKLIHAGMGISVVF